MKTYEDKGTKVDYFDYGDGREALFFRTEEFKGLQLGAFKLGWTNKFAIVSPSQISKGTLDVMSANASVVTGSNITSNDFIVFSEGAEVKKLEKRYYSLPILKIRFFLWLKCKSVIAEPKELIRIRKT